MPESPDPTDVLALRAEIVRIQAVHAAQRALALAGGRVGPARNTPCPCGSGKKYKRCHGSATLRELMPRRTRRKKTK